MNYYFNYKNRMQRIFKKSSDADLLIFFNSQVKNPGWCHAKMIYLYCLQKEMIKRFDTSNLIVDGNCSYANYILLRNKKILIIL